MGYFKSIISLLFIVSFLAFTKEATAQLRFTSIEVTTTNQGANYNYFITTGDGTGSVSITYEPLPDWLSLTDNENGTASLTGISQHEDVGNHGITIYAQDGLTTISQSFNINVVNMNDAPTFTSNEVTDIGVGQTYIYNITTEDIDGDATAITDSVLPFWLSLTDNGDGTGLLTGDPGVLQEGSHHVVLTVSDWSLSTNQDFHINVTTNNVPTYTSIPATEVNQNSSYHYLIETEDLDGDPVSLDAGLLPDWLTLGSDGGGNPLLSGIPEQEDVGTYDIVITANDGTADAMQSFTIEVININDSPSYESTPITVGTQNSEYRYNISATDIDGDAITITDTSIPTWLTLTDNEDGTATLIGTPAQENVGTHNIIITASDGELDSTQTFSIVIDDVNDAPTFTSTEITVGTQNIEYSYTITTNDLDGDAITITDISVPAWLAFTDNEDGTATLIGTPSQTEVGVHAIVLTASDLTDSNDHIFNITVANINDAPTFDSTPAETATEDLEYSYTASATDIDGDDLQFSAISLPDWITLTDNKDGTATLLGTPTNDDLGIHTVDFSVTDGIITDPIIQTYMLTVNGINDAPIINGQSTVSISEETDFIIDLSMLNVSDIDNIYPTDFSLVVNSGTNYTLDGTTITPDANFNGILIIPVQVDDGEATDSLSEIFSFELEVVAVNDSPELLNIELDELTYAENDESTLITSTIEAIDIDNVNLSGATISISDESYVDGEDILAFANTLTIIGSWDANTGVLNLQGSATILEYTEALRAITYENGSENPTQLSKTIEFRVSDGDSTSLIVFRNILITAENDPPVATSFSVPTTESTNVNIAMLSRFSDVDANLDLATLTVTVPPNNGSTSVNLGTSTITYSPTNGYSGSDTFTYQICDDQGACETGVITINISNEAPAPQNDAIETPEDVSVKIDVLANDTDPQDNIDVNSLTIITPPANGTIEVDADENMIIYTPNENYNGLDQFTYSVCDLTSYCTEAIVNITVTAVNDEPILNNDYTEINEDNPVIIEVLNNDNDATDPLSGLNRESVAITVAPNHGTAQVINGTIEYTPAPDYFGYDTLIYSVSDLGIPLPAITREAEAVVLVKPVNDAPIIISQQPSQTNEDNSIEITLSHINVIDVDNTYPEGFTLIIQSGNNYTTNGNTITPNANYYGNLVVPVQVSDGQLENARSNIFNLNVTVLPINDKPIALDDAAYTGELTAVNIAILGNDSDPADILGGINGNSIQIITYPKHGSSIVLPNHVINYTPYSGFWGTDTLIYRVEDIGYPTPVKADTATVLINISRLSPKANNDDVTIEEDNNIDIHVLDNDTDSGNDINPSTVRIVTAPLNGAIISINEGIINYMPNLNFNGEDSFEYTVKDYTNFTSNKATVSITVTPKNDVPVANNESYNTQEGVPIQISMMDIITDPENNIDFGTMTITSAPTNGITRVDAIEQLIIYTPNNGYSGNDAFSFQVADLEKDTSNIATISIFISDQAPIANDDEYVIDEDTPSTFDVTANDIDPQNNLNPLSIQIIENPEQGIASINSENGEITYTPKGNYFGNDSFDYTVCDNDGYCDRAKVDLTIRSVNDTPIIVNDTLIVNEDQSISIETLLNDYDVDGSLDLTTLSITTEPANGTAKINGNNGEINYQPKPDYFGTDQFTYSICDDSSSCATADVIITIEPINDAPVATNDITQAYTKTKTSIDVLTNDFDVDGNIDTTTLKIISAPRKGFVQIQTKGIINYTSNTDYIGIDQFDYAICDSNGECSQATVTINVTSGNTAPIALPDTSSVFEDTDTTIDVLNNDFDANNNIDISRLEIISAPKHGIASINFETGQISYTPNPNYNGLDSIKYKIFDTELLADSAKVIITIIPANDAPIATNDFVVVLDGIESSFNVLLNDYDIDANDVLQTTIVPENDLTNFQINLTTNGELIIIADLGFYCNERTITYQVCDNENTCTSATVLIEVDVADNDNDNIPNAIEGLTIDTDGDGTLNYIDNDSDNDNIPDQYEANITDICNALPVNSDNDDTPDYLDTDSDNDGILDALEGIEDCDEDGESNYTDYFDDCTDRIKAPNTFSPNNDGVNDYFVIPIITDYPENELIIYNRWGSEIYRMTNYDNSWDGRSSSSTLGSDILPEGSYFYVLNLVNDDKVIKGSVFIKR